MVTTVRTEKPVLHPRSARGLGAWKQAPPSAAVAAACGLLSLSHGQVTQRGAAADTAAAPVDSAPRRFATGPPPARAPPTPTVNACDWQARAAAPNGLSHWLELFVNPPLALHPLRPL